MGGVATSVSHYPCNTFRATESLQLVLYRTHELLALLADSTEGYHPDATQNQLAEETSALKLGIASAAGRVSRVFIRCIPAEEFFPTYERVSRLDSHQGSRSSLPEGDPSKSTNRTSSIPKMVLKWSSGLATVAEQEMNRTRRLPKAAQTRLRRLIMNATCDPIRPL